MARDAHVFKQFCLDPAARDPRVRITWQRSYVPGVLYEAELTGNPNVRLYWNANDTVEHLASPTFRIRHEPRCPTALCTNILLGLLHLCQKENTHVLHFRSAIRLLRSVRINSVDHFYFHALADALRMWQLLNIAWHRLDMPPPIKSVKYGPERVMSSRAKTREITIEFNKRWLKECTKPGSVKVRLPLPMHGTSMNMVLYTLAIHVNNNRRRVNQDINTFTGKVSGNRHALGTRPYMPLASWPIVKEWYANNNGKIEWRRTPYRTVVLSDGRLGRKPSTTFSITYLRKPS